MGQARHDPSDLITRLVPILVVRDLEAERAFYEALGLRVTYEGPEYPDFIGLGNEAVEFGLERPKSPSDTSRADGEPARDAGSEPAQDAGSEPAQDAGSEPAQDAGSEPAQDAGSELAQDAGSEPGREAGSEPAQDAGSEPAQDANGEPGPGTRADLATRGDQRRRGRGPVRGGGAGVHDRGPRASAGLALPDAEAPLPQRLRSGAGGPVRARVAEARATRSPQRSAGGIAGPRRQFAPPGRQRLSWE